LLLEKERADDTVALRVGLFVAIPATVNGVTGASPHHDHSAEEQPDEAADCHSFDWVADRRRPCRRLLHIALVNQRGAGPTGSHNRY